MKNNVPEIPILKTNKYYSTQELSKLFKANESTIKRWADSGKLKCFKTPGGHRKYTPEHISEFISNYHYEIISPESGLLLQGEDELVSAFLAKGDFQTVSEMIFGEAVKSKKENVFSVLKGCHEANVPLVSIYDDVVLPAVAKALEHREQGKLSVVEEQLTRNVMLESLFQFKLLSQKIMFTERVAITCAASNGMVEVGLACAEHLLEVSGWRVFSLGVNNQFEALTETIASRKPGLICLSADYVTSQQIGIESLSKLKTIASEKGILLLFGDFRTTSDAMVEKRLQEFSWSKFSTLNEMLSALYNQR